MDTFSRSMANRLECSAVPEKLSGNTGRRPDRPPDGQETTVGRAISSLFRDPVGTLLVRWNWKSALLSSLLRATIFFLANLTAGWRAAVGAMLAELILRSLTSGFYGAITEAFSVARPVWKATAATMVGLPILNHGLEFLVHWLRHTPALGTSIAASMVFTSVSTAFNLYAMRHGFLTVGGRSKSLVHDLVHIPVLLFRFVCEGPRLLLSLVSFWVRPQ
jgi:hypothetical protein